MSNVLDQYHTYMDNVETMFDLKLSGDKPYERLEALRQAVLNNKELSGLISNYATMRKQNIMTRVTNNNDSATDIKKQVAELIFTFFVKGVSHLYTLNSAPLRHHWIPCAYLKSFGTRNSNRKISIPLVDFKDGKAVDKNVIDRSFAHDYEGKKGFYDLAIENTFGSLEDFFATANINKETSHSLMSLASVSLFLAQVIRNPKNGDFEEGSLERIFNSFISILNEFDAIYARGVSLARNTPFSAYLPERVFKRVNGQKIYTFPVDKSTVYMFSEQPFSHEIALTQGNRYRKNMITMARLNEGKVYGITTDEI